MAGTWQMVYIIFFILLEIEPKALWMPGKYDTNEFHPHPYILCKPVSKNKQSSK